MPAVRLFNRRTLLGGDDLQLPSLLTILVRLFQAIFLLLPLAVILLRDAVAAGGWIQYISQDPAGNGSASCRGAHYFPLFLTIYVGLSLIYSLLTIKIEAELYSRSSIGTPTQPELRQAAGVVKLLEAKLVPVAFANAATFLVGVLALSFNGKYHSCVGDEDEDDAPPTLWWYAFIFLLLTQFAEIIISALAMARVMSNSDAHALTRTGETSLRSVGSGELMLGHVPHRQHELVEEMWHDRCRFFCRCLSVSTCFLFGGRDIDTGDFSNVARALADYFEDGGILDLVPSDIVAGFIMLRRVQRQRVLEARSILASIESGAGDGDGPTVSSLRDSAIINVTQEKIFDKSDAYHPLTSPEPVSSDIGRITSVQSFGSDPLAPMPDPASPVTLHSHPSEAYQPSALAFKMEHTDTRTWYETMRRNVLCRNDDDDRAAVAEGARFARHALAIYTWVLYIYMHPFKGPCSLACAPCFACGTARRIRRDEEEGYGSCSAGDSRIIGDNCCNVHRTSLLNHAGLVDADLIYANLKSSFDETPYCIVVDHRWKSVVVSVRGTLSIEDCVVDILVDPASLEELGETHGFDGRGEYCHGGALNETQWIYRDLQRHRILDQLLLGPNAEFPQYSLRFVGHSLGAACAVLLSYMMKRDFPTLRCLCYSPPGGFITRKLAVECKEFCTSFVLDSDLVPRLSVDSVEHLRNEVLELIGRVKVPKKEVVEHAFSGGLPCIGERGGNGMEDPDDLVEANARMLHPQGATPLDTDFARQLDRVKRIHGDRRRSRTGVRDVPLFPPGKICHLVKTDERHSCSHGLMKCLTCCTTNIGSEYTAVWIENDDLNEIVISPTLWTDHFPNRVCLEIEGIANAFGLDTNLGSSESDRERARLNNSISLGGHRQVSEMVFT